MEHDTGVFVVYIVNNMHNLTESNENVAIFRYNMTRNADFIPYYAAAVRCQCIAENSVPLLYQNMASIVTWYNKRLFLSVIAELMPCLLWQRSFRQGKEDEVPLFTPLEVAVHQRDYSMVQFILSLGCIIEYSNTNRSEYENLISECIIEACDLYSEPYSIEENDIIDTLRKEIYSESLI